MTALLPGPSHREVAHRPPGHGRVVEVHRRRGAGLVYDLLVITWNPRNGVHTHTLRLGTSRTEAVLAAQRIAHGHKRH